MHSPSTGYALPPPLFVGGKVWKGEIKKASGEVSVCLARRAKEKLTGDLEFAPGVFGYLGRMGGGEGVRTHNP